MVDLVKFRGAVYSLVRISRRSGFSLYIVRVEL